MRDDIGTYLWHVESASRLVNAKADLDIVNNDHLAPVDLGLDSTSQSMKIYLRSIMKQSKRLT